MHRHLQLPTPHEAARLLNGVIHGDRILCPGPGHSARDLSLEVWLNPSAPGGFLVHSFAGDDWQLCRDYVLERLGLAQEQRRPGSRPPRLKVPTLQIVPDKKTTANGLAIWHSAVDVRGTLAEQYLASRCIQLKISMGHAIRYHGALYHEGSQVPGMVALFRDLHTNKPCGIHRTFLDARGQKIDRKMLGRAKGAAIKLDVDEDVTCGLYIGEGIETCLTARQLGYRPVWALGSSGAIAAFPVLPGVEAINILAENDEASERAGNACCARYLDAGCDAYLVVPPEGSKDLNDALRRAA